MTRPICFVLTVIGLGAAIASSAGARTSATSISTGAATEITFNAATVPVHLSSTEFGQMVLEYGTTTGYGSEVGRSGFSPETVTVGLRLQNLKPGTTYHFAATANTPSFPPFTATYHSADRTFTTKPAERPTARALSATPTHDCRCAVIRAGIFSGGLDVSFHVEYGTSPKLGRKGEAGKLSGMIGALDGGAVAYLHIPNLKQGTKYYFRIVATNHVGSASSPLGSFTMV